jgi:PAS domain S-box-containing protein
MVAFAGYPLLVEDREVGVVAMFARHRLTEVTLTALVSISNNIALGIEHKRAETAVRETEERFKELAGNLSDVFWMTAPDMKNIFYVSPAYEKLWGRTCQSLYDQPMSFVDAIHPDDRQGFLKVLADKKTQGEFQTEYRVVRPDGSVRWIWDRGFPVRNQGGELIRVVGIAQDITERKQAEETLQRLRGQHALILNSVGEGVHGLDLDGQITFENPASAAMLGFEMADLIGRSAHGTMHHTRPDGTPYPQSECLIYTTLRDGVVRRVRGEVFWRKDGTSFPVEYTSAPLHDEDGRIIGVTVVFTDITERKRAQAELEDIHKQLVEASRRSGMAEIATNVLHNVGNVLNSVNVSTGLVVESVKRSKTSSLARVVVLLQEHAHDLGAFITNDSRGKHLPAYLAQLSDLLLAEQEINVRELDSLRRNVEHIKEIVAMQQNYATFGGVKEMINVANLVEDSLRLNEDALGRQSVKVIREFEAVPPLNVEKHKILQILVNVLRNAKHACQDSECADKQITVRVAIGDGRIRISVIDNGVGIPPENLTRIFNHGFTTRKGGHGFGLHSGALAAKEMDGSLTVQSAGPGQGATFTLELPCPTRENSHE